MHASLHHTREAAHYMIKLELERETHRYNQLALQVSKEAEIRSSTAGIPCAEQITTKGIV